MSFPPVLFINRAGDIDKWGKEELAEFDNDPRGILWMWEPPLANASYVMGIDPSVGITGWNRYARTKSDKHINNGSIEIIRMGVNGAQDVQVAEYAAPVDATDLGYIANIVGRIYKGKEDDQCSCIGELTGPGPVTLRTMAECGYLNQWMWQYYGDLVVTESKKVWWNATPSTLRDLWIKSSRHIAKNKVKISSPWLGEELVDARYDKDRMYDYSPDNAKGHGDRKRAFFLALWAANGWSMEAERTQEIVETAKAPVDMQMTDMSMDEIYDRWSNACNW